MSINRNNTALLVVDIQGTLARTVEGANLLQPNWIKMIRVARLFNLPILVLEQYPEGLGETIPELKAELKDCFVYSKRSFSGYRNNAFKSDLKALSVENILMMGVEAHVCVLQTALDILKNETLLLYLLVDGVSSRRIVDRDLAISRLEKAGAVATTIEMSAFELMEDSRDEVFKEFLKIIK